MAEKEEIRAASEWPNINKKFKPTAEQRQLKRKTGSYYHRDEQVAPYEVRNGEFA